MRKEVRTRFPQIKDKINLKDIAGIFFGNEPETFAEGSDLKAVSDSLSGYVPITRALTINGTVQDLSSNRTWNVGTVTSVGTTGLITGGTITGAGTITTSMSTNKLVGRGTAGTGIMEEITLGTNLSLTGTTLNAAAPIGVALTKTDDTNVTLTLGGSPTTALLAATSLTLGWTGKLALSRFTQGTTGTVLQGVTSSDSIYTSSPTISTSVTTPLVIGGTGTGSDLILQSTSGNGDDTSWVITKVGNNGSVETLRQGVALSPDATATGGTITTSGAYTIHTFTSGGTFTVSGGSLSVDYLVVAGGGGGGGCNSSAAGGGGAGGYQTGTGFSVPIGSYSITVGAGGAGGSAGENPGLVGSDSIFSSITANGGGAGAAGNINGGNGGSGGGAAGFYGKAGGTGSQGSNGGSGSGAPTYSGGGGGGATSVGSAAGTNGGSGGSGTANSISGASVTYSGGGGGGSTGSGTGGTGGSGGGGAGGKNTAGTNGTLNTGGGGGGAGNASGTHAGGAGGSGIVIIRYLTPSTTKRPVIGINKSTPTAQLHIGAGTGNQYTGQIQLDAGILLATPVDGTIEYKTGAFVLQKDALLIGGGTSLLSTETLSIQKNQSGLTYGLISNTTSATTAQTAFQTLTNAGLGLTMRALSPAFTTSSINVASTSVLSSDQLSGFNIGTTSNTQLSFWTNNTKKSFIPSTGGFVIGTAALATNATDGFLYIPTCAGTPTGTPTTQTGTVAMIYDTTNNKFYIYNGGWKGGTTPGVFA